MKGEKASGLYFPIAAVQVCGSDESATGLQSSVPQCWAIPSRHAVELISKIPSGSLLWPVQCWDSSTWEIENGTYFGLIAALTFKGPFEISGVSSACCSWTSPRCTCLFSQPQGGGDPGCQLQYIVFHPHQQMNCTCIAKL